MTERQKIERLAEWLNGICVDWPPLGYDWTSAPRERRKEMRELAAKAAHILAVGECAPDK